MKTSKSTVLQCDLYQTLPINQSAKRGRFRRDLVGAGSTKVGQNLGQLSKSWGSLVKFWGRNSNVGAAHLSLGQINMSGTQIIELLKLNNRLNDDRGAKLAECATFVSTAPLLQ